MIEVKIKLHRKNSNYDLKLTLDKFKTEFKSEINKVLDIYCAKEKVSNFDFDELLTKNIEEIQKFFNIFGYYFNNYVGANWTFVSTKVYDKFLFGTKVYDSDKKIISLILKTWVNTFSGNNGPVFVEFATCVDSDGSIYNTAFANLTPYDELDEAALK